MGLRPCPACRHCRARAAPHSLRGRLLSQVFLGKDDPSGDDASARADGPPTQTNGSKDAKSGWRAAMARTTSALSLRSAAQKQQGANPGAGAGAGSGGDAELSHVRYNGGLFIQTRDSLALQSLSGLHGHKLPQVGTEFVWGGEHELDCKGLLYYLGSGGGAHLWSNPADEGLVSVTGCKWNAPGRIEDVANCLPHVKQTCWSSDTEAAWVCVELPAGILLEVTRYTLRHGYSSGAHLRSWDLLVSLDGEAWQPAARHVDDHSLQGGFGVRSFPVASQGHPGPAKMFKIAMTGGNSIGGKQVRTRPAAARPRHCLTARWACARAARPLRAGALRQDPPPPAGGHSQAVPLVLPGLHVTLAARQAQRPGVVGWGRPA